MQCGGFKDEGGGRRGWDEEGVTKASRNPLACDWEWAGGGGEMSRGTWTTGTCQPVFPDMQEVDKECEREVRQGWMGTGQPNST